MTDKRVNIPQARALEHFLDYELDGKAYEAVGLAADIRKELEALGELLLQAEQKAHEEDTTPVTRSQLRAWLRGERYETDRKLKAVYGVSEQPAATLIYAELHAIGERFAALAARLMAEGVPSSTKS